MLDFCVLLVIIFVGCMYFSRSCVSVESTTMKSNCMYFIRGHVSIKLIITLNLGCTCFVRSCVSIKKHNSKA